MKEGIRKWKTQKMKKLPDRDKGKHKEGASVVHLPAVLGSGKLVSHTTYWTQPSKSMERGRVSRWTAHCRECGWYSLHVPVAEVQDSDTETKRRVIHHRGNSACQYGKPGDKKRRCRGRWEGRMLHQRNYGRDYQGSQRVEQVTGRWSGAVPPADQLVLHCREAAPPPPLGH
ncbi:hypothetical protein F7725_008145 [Dissostichus mawsoni]|uniref:Uncharacterized protein n=1 Tax=Dissostichus mawsoni TaxID=36200 RepID=A0A7J5Y6C3_DISMA|nr:hypothetical protein F7725_008145 [Dissostichus mawsoni]